MNSFSRCHTLPYSAAALQEMNLYSRYPHIYWQCACLTVNASADETNEDNKSTNYGKVASAIGAMKSQGVEIALPDINHAGFGFTPDPENNQIVYGLKGLVGVGDDVCRQIIKNRPYISLQDFYDKNKDIGATSIITLVKAGCFDSIDHSSREEIMRHMLMIIAEDKVPDKSSLSLANFAAMQSMQGFIPQIHSFAARVTAFRSFVFSPQNHLVGSKPKSYKVPPSAQIFFENELLRFFTEGEDFEYRGDTLCLFHAKFEKAYKKIAEPFSAWFKSPSTLELFNQKQKEMYVDGLYQKYCSFSPSHWEIESLSFYHGPHELSKVQSEKYGISSFYALPETPEVIEIITRKDKKTGKEISYERYALSRIAGTVLDRSNIRHTVTLLTPDGVVTVKFYESMFVHLNKQISTVEESTGKKTVHDKSWLRRGNLLLLTGIRRGDTFCPKVYQDSVYHTPVTLIQSVSPTGELSLITQRAAES